MVHDPDRVTSGRQSNNIYHPQNESKTPKKYLRLYPRLPRDDPLGGTPAATQTISDEPLTAYLDLAAAPLLGRGNHSFVHRASLRLPSPLEVDSSTGEVTVAAKTAFNDYDERKMLADEGKIYDAFPEHLMESWSGFNLVAPLKDPVPVGPVVPRFYGYYVCNNDPTERLSPILLQEECGTPVKPKLLTPDDRYFNLVLCICMQHLMTCFTISGVNVSRCSSACTTHDSFRIRSTFGTSWCNLDP